MGFNIEADEITRRQAEPLTDRHQVELLEKGKTTFAEVKAKDRLTDVAEFGAATVRFAQGGTRGEVTLALTHSPDGLATLTAQSGLKKSPLEVAPVQVYEWLKILEAPDDEDLDGLVVADAVVHPVGSGPESRIGIRGRLIRLPKGALADIAD